MAKSGISLKLKGFDKLLEEIQRANGDIKAATEQAMNKSVAVVEKELHQHCDAAGVPSSVSSAIRADRAQWRGNVCEAEVGWKLGAYDPKNPSQGHKAIFLNYGTPHRKKHGKVKGRLFIGKAKDASEKQVKKIQKQTLEEILKGLNG